MFKRRWPFALLLTALVCSEFVGCSSKAPEQSSIDHEAIRKQQINRAGRESGAN
jgi:hypothetical protein